MKPSDYNQQRANLLSRITGFKGGLNRAARQASKVDPVRNRKVYERLLREIAIIKDNLQVAEELLEIFDRQNPRPEPAPKPRLPALPPVHRVNPPAAAFLLVECTTCGAQSGEFCKTVEGINSMARFALNKKPSKKVQTHKARMDRYTQQYLEGE